MKSGHGQFARTGVGVAVAWLLAGCGGLPPDKGTTGDGDGAGEGGVLDDAGTSAAVDGAATTPDSGGDGASTGDAADPSSVTTIPLTGCPSSGYAASFTIGGQPFDLIVDTGSGDLAVASAECTNCTGVTPTYTPGATATDDGRQVTSQYGIGTWSGELYTDTVAISAAALSTSMTFAAIRTQAQFFAPSGCNFGAVAFAPQGIAGFGPTALATPHADVFMSRLVAQSLVPNTFAVELCPIGGQLWLGGFDAQAAATTADVSYTPMTASGFYSLTLDDLQLGGQTLGFGSSDFGTTIVDTGTTSLALPSTVLTALTQAITSNSVFASSFTGASGNWLVGTSTTNSCFSSPHSTSELDAMLPGISLVMPADGGGTLTITLTATESYLAPAVDTKNGTSTTYYCSGVLENTAKTASTILGVAAMSAHLIVFDGAGMRIGFAPQTHCR
jgi:hypothetical protein